MAGTVNYSSGVFTIIDGEVSVADCVTEKGSAIVSTDEIFIYTGTTMGILGVLNSESFSCDVYVGKDASSTKSLGKLKIYGGGTVTIPSAGNFECVKDYGMFDTYNTSSSSKATLDGNQCSNDILLRGAFNVKFLDITNIKSGGDLDVDGINGILEFLTVSGYGDAVYNWKGVPGDGFHTVSCDLGKASPGIFTEDGEPDIDLLTDAYIRDANPSRPNQFGYAGVDGRRSAMLLKGAIYAGSCKVRIEPTSTALNKTIKKNLEYIHSNQLPFLFVLTSHEDVSLPNDLIWRGRLGEALHPLNTWDMRTQELTVMEDT